MCENCTRREFLGTTALGGMMLAAGPVRMASASAVAPAAALPSKVRIAAIFAGRPVPSDRSWGVCEEEIAAMTKALQDVEKKLGNVEFVVGQAATPEEADALLKQAGDDAPVLAVNLSIGGLLRVSGPILESGRPLAVYSAPASGHDWMYPFRWRQEGKPVTLFTSSDYAELEHAARVLRVVPLMKHSRILVFLPLRGTAPACSPEEIAKRFGTEVVIVPQERYDQLLEAVDPEKAKAEAKAWSEGASKTIEPTEEDVWQAARVSIALQQLMEEEKANGLAVGTCMGWLKRGFPCLGFTRLRDAGIPASCEGDMDSLWTMMLFQHMFGLPGFQGNATFDTAKNAVWTAHCVGPLKMDGPDGPAAPYLLRSHSEIGGGIVPEIQYRLGQKITRTKLVNLDKLLISTGTIREVPDKSVRACRTQIVTEVADAAKMVRNWGGGVLEGDMMTLLHRVVFYGDHIRSARHLADLMKMEVIEEG
ncbi:MAG: hypothetical protein KJ000_11785 [Pirellulaceae bacterium]|nr:hypothetical protein [Pirellulaceae bacterium]